MRDDPTKTASVTLTGFTEPPPRWGFCYAIANPLATSQAGENHQVVGREIRESVSCPDSQVSGHGSSPSAASPPGRHHPTAATWPVRPNRPTLRPYDGRYRAQTGRSHQSRHRGRKRRNSRCRSLRPRLRAGVTQPGRRSSIVIRSGHGGKARSDRPLHVRSTDYGLRTTDCGLRQHDDPGADLGPAECELRIVEVLSDAPAGSKCPELLLGLKR